MYIPAYFRMSDEETALEVMEAHSFATLFTQHNGLPVATHLPLLLDREKRVLHGHFARPNPQWQDCEGQVALAVFQGPHCYISPSWYETNQTVPTWNYVTVHVYGEIRLVEGEQVLQSLHDQVLKYETPDSAYRLPEVDAELLAGLHKGIQGFQLHISSIEGKAKLSQNHSAARQARVIEQLERSTHDNERQIAALMRQNLLEDSI